MRRAKAALSYHLSSRTDAGADMLPLLVYAMAQVRVRVGSTLWIRGRHATPTGLCDGAGGPDVRLRVRVRVRVRIRVRVR